MPVWRRRSVLIVIGCWQAWKRHRRHPWIIGMMIGGTLGWILSLGIRLGTSDGQELSGRAATYIYIPVSVIAALALTRLVNSAPMRRLGAAATAFVAAAVVALLIDGLSNGWPPFWERLPGPHQVASFEASVDPQEVAVSYWSLAQLGPGNVIASDSGIYPVLIGYGDQNPQQQVTFLYSTPTWTLPVAQPATQAGGAERMFEIGAGGEPDDGPSGKVSLQRAAQARLVGNTRRPSRGRRPLISIAAEVEPRRARLAHALHQQTERSGLDFGI